VQKKEAQTDLSVGLDEGVDKISNETRNEADAPYNPNRTARWLDKVSSTGYYPRIQPRQTGHWHQEPRHRVPERLIRYKPAVQMKGVNINDDTALKDEATRMGNKESQIHARIEKPKENRSRTVANSVARKQRCEGHGFGFVDKRPETVAQKKLQEMANNSPQVKQFQEMMCNYSVQNRQSNQHKTAPVQRVYDFSKNWKDCNNVGKNEKPEVSVEDVVNSIKNEEVVKYRDATDGGGMYIKTDWHVSQTDTKVHFTAELGLNELPWESYGAQIN
jgi:hypothetical protein